MSWKEKRLRKVVEDAQLRAARAVQGLFVAPDQPGHNPDAGATWKECSTRTRAALILTQGTMAADRAKSQSTTTNVFGVVVMPERIEDHDAWERKAARLRGRVIDALPAEGAFQRGPGLPGVPAELVARVQPQPQAPTEEANEAGPEGEAGKG